MSTSVGMSQVEMDLLGHPQGVAEGKTAALKSNEIQVDSSKSDGNELAASELAIIEKTLVRKLDLHLIPLVMLLYLMSFIDRVNIGNARLYNLEEDLGLTGNQFQVAVSILFVTYIVFEIPSNLVLKLFTPRRWIAFITVAWGLVATFTGFVNSYGALIACRLLLGAFEAGLFPGLNVYLTFFYSKNELALRVGYLFVSAAIAGGLGGLLAYGIGHMQGLADMNGWRWIMIIEGIPTCLLGIATYWALPNDPGTAYFLNDNEKSIMAARRKREYGSTASAQEFSRQDMFKAFSDWKVWMFCIGQFGADTMLYGYSTFLPTIINGLGDWSVAEVQLLTVPCYFLGAASYMTIAFLSDRTRMRGLYCVLFGAVSVVGYGVLMSPSSQGVNYFGCFLVAMGLYIHVGLPLAWLPNNSPRYGKRTTATGMQLSIGNCAGIMAPFIYSIISSTSSGIATTSFSAATSDVFSGSSIIAESTASSGSLIASTSASTSVGASESAIASSIAASSGSTASTSRLAPSAVDPSSTTVPSDTFISSGSIGPSSVAQSGTATISDTFVPFGSLVAPSSVTLSGTATPSDTLISSDATVSSSIFAPSGTLIPPGSIVSPSSVAVSSTLVPSGAVPSSTLSRSATLIPSGSAIASGTIVPPGSAVPSGTESSSPVPPTPGFPDEINGFAFYGCGASDAGFPSFQLAQTSSEMDIDTCTTACQGSEFAGVYSTDCYCGQIVDLTVDEGQCDIPCPGDANQLCGCFRTSFRAARGLSNRQVIPNTILLTVYVAVDDGVSSLPSGPSATVTATATATETISSITTATVTGTSVIAPSSTATITYTATSTITACIVGEECTVGSVTTTAATTTIQYCYGCPRPTSVRCNSSTCYVVTIIQDIYYVLKPHRGEDCPGETTYVEVPLDGETGEYSWKPLKCTNGICDGKKVWKPESCPLDMMEEMSQGGKYPIVEAKPCVCEGGVSFGLIDAGIIYEGKGDRDGYSHAHNSVGSNVENEGPRPVGDSDVENKSEHSSVDQGLSEDISKDMGNGGNEETNEEVSEDVDDVSDTSGQAPTTGDSQTSAVPGDSNVYENDSTSAESGYGGEDREGDDYSGGGHADEGDDVIVSATPRSTVGFITVLASFGVAFILY